MPGPLMPEWLPRLKPENASVLDSRLVQVLRALVNANPLPEAVEPYLPNPNPLQILRDPASQVMGLMTTQVPTGRAALTREVAKRVEQPIKAYHGSPHDFERFDTSKIGTGEGAQAYGHGLYFAENPRVAADYKKKLYDKHVGNFQTGLKDAVIAGEPGRFIDYDANVSRLAKAGASQDVAETVADYMVTFSEDAPTSHTLVKHLRNESLATPATRKAADWLKANPDVIRHKGRMYEVAIKADPESFLDWDKPLSQQSGVLQKLRNSPDYDTRFRDILEMDMVDDPTITGDLFHDKLKYAAQEDQATPAQLLKGSGIPGIKYLDQGSRAAGEGSRNYVIFDDALVEILRKYGLLPFAAGVTAQGLSDAAPPPEAAPGTANQYGGRLETLRRLLDKGPK